MTEFFDLSIPAPTAPPTAAAAKTLNESRLRCVVRALTLGYTAVAYDRPHRGVLSDSSISNITPIPLSSLLAAAPALAADVSLHRNLVGAKSKSPFRQYSRITVSVDSEAAASTLNAGNLVLRSYDLVAARPGNQAAFDQACKVSEIDIIAIDFSQKLPFRLKLPMIEAATKRGIHFEITYSHLIGDVNVRRQMLSEAKLLVEWTRGRNLIFSSAASTVNEIRGPYDVANMYAFLLGITMERAKAAISGNCRSLLANALRKKHCYKEAIRVERILPNELNLEGAWFGDWKDWDPISSGDGDIPPLDDTVKYFSGASEVPRSSIVTNFVSGMDERESNGEILGDNQVPENTKASTFAIPEEPVLLVGDEVSFVSNDIIQEDRLVEHPVDERISTSVRPIEQQACQSEDNVASSSRVLTAFAYAEEADLPSSDSDGQVTANMDSIFSDPTEMLLDGIAFSEELDDTTLKNCIAVGEGNLMTDDANLSPALEITGPSNMTIEDHKMTVGATCVPSIIATSDEISTLVDCLPGVSGDQTVYGGICTIEETYLPKDQIVAGPNEGQHTNQLSSFSYRHFRRCALIESTPSAASLSINTPLTDTFNEIHEQGQHELFIAGTSDFLDKGSEKREGEQQNFYTTSDGIRPRTIKSGKRRHKERSHCPAYPLPFKAILKPMRFKKKARRLRRSSKHV